MSEVPSRPRRSSGGPSSSLVPSPGALRSGAYSRRLSRQEAISLLSGTDRDLLQFLTEHRVATTHHVQTLLDLPERTARYRLERLKSLGMAGAVRPYAERASEPNHWYPTKTADAWARGAPIPQGGERERPNESFVRHAAAVTGLYVALVRLGPVLGFSVASSSRETEAKEEFRTEGRTTCVVPDLAVVLLWEEAEYRAFVEVDLGTMSLPRLYRKFATYAAYAEEEAWGERHPFLPALLVLTTTRKRVEAVVRAWEQRFLHPSSRRRASRFPKAGTLAVGASDAVHQPEAAITEAVWLAPGSVDGLSLRDLLDPPWRRRREEVARRRAAREQREAIWGAIWEGPPGRRRDMLREQGARFFPPRGTWHHDPDERQKTVAHLLAGEGEMSEAERNAFRTFCDRRTEILGERLVVSSRYAYAEVTEDEAAALDELHGEYLTRQRRAVATLYATHAESPTVAEAIAELDAARLLTPTKERELSSEATRDLRIIDRIKWRAGEYLAWRESEVHRDRRGAGVVRGLFFDRDKAEAWIDGSYVRVCPTCRHVLASVPPPQDIFGRREHRAERCPFDPDHKLVGLAEAIELGLVEEDGYGFWRPCRRGVPTWIRQLSPFPISIEEARSR